MLGVKSSSIWISWLIHALTTNFISIILIVIILKTCLFGVSYSAVEYSDGTILFLFLFLYCISAITFCFLVATIFKNRETLEIKKLYLIYLIDYFSFTCNNYWNLVLAFLLLYTSGPCAKLRYIVVVMETHLRRFSQHELVSWFCMHGGIRIERFLYRIVKMSNVIKTKTAETGLQWSNFFQPASGNVKNDFTMGHVFAMFLFDIIFFMTCTLYIENFRPGKYGIPKPWYFPLLYFRKVFYYFKCIFK